MMVGRNKVGWAVLAVGLAAANCGGAVEEPVPAGCALPSSTQGDGSGQVRLAHLLATNDAIDLCLRPAGAPWPNRAVLSGAGSDPNSLCGSGLPYTQVTAPLKVAAGKTDVKVIAAGQTCFAPSLAEKSGIEVGTDLVITVAYMGGSSVAPLIAAMPETPPSTVAHQNRLTRFVNAVPGTTLDFGVTDLPGPVPLTMKAHISNGIEFGRTSDAAGGAPAFTFDIRGYFEFGSVDLPTVAAHKGTTDALLLATLSGAGNFTLYAVGDPDTTFPIRGLLCSEAKSRDANSRTDCIVTELPSPN